MSKLLQLNYFISITFSCLLLFFTSLTADLTNLKFKIIKEDQILVYLPKLSEIYQLNYCKEPYFHQATDKEYTTYLKKLAYDPQALICLAIEEDQVKGVLTGRPFTTDNIKERKEELDHAQERDHFYDSDLYYLGELIVLAELDNETIAKALYAKGEAAIKDLNTYTHICFNQLLPLNEKELENISLNSLAANLGFTYYPEWQNPFSLKNQSHHSSQQLIYWMKNLYPILQ